MHDFAILACLRGHGGRGRSGAGVGGWDGVGDERNQVDNPRCRLIWEQRAGMVAFLYYQYSVKVCKEEHKWAYVPPRH